MRHNAWDCAKQLIAVLTSKVLPTSYSSLSHHAKHQQAYTALLLAGKWSDHTHSVYICCSFQSKYKHLWDASERSVRSAAAVTALEPASTEVPPGPLEHALSTRGETPTPNMAHRGVSDAEGMHAEGTHMSQSAKQGSTALGLTGRWSSLFSRRSGIDDYRQHEDDLTGSNYVNRDY